MLRLKLTIAYDGTSFAGWQSQRHANTIQDRLENTIAKVAGAPLRLHGASRTDSGVHALGQVAHVDLPNEKLSAERWQSALNALLPPGIRVVRASFVGAKFHARFSAKGKIYRYRIWTDPVLSPFEIGRAWHVREQLDFEKIKTAARSFIGTHDFANYAANRGHKETDTIRTVRSVKARAVGPLITLEFDGNGFLYKMVRLMTGAIVRCGASTSDLSALRASLESTKSKRIGFVAPAGGLFLVRVRY